MIILGVIIVTNNIALLLGTRLVPIIIVMAMNIIPCLVLLLSYCCYIGY